MAAQRRAHSLSQGGGNNTTEGGTFWLALEGCMGFYREIEGKVMLG